MNGRLQFPGPGRVTSTAAARIVGASQVIGGLGGGAAGLFEHGCVAQSLAISTGMGTPPALSVSARYDTPLWDPDGYMQGDALQLRVPTGCGGTHLVLLSSAYMSPTAAVDGYWRQCIDIGGSISGSAVIGGTTAGQMQQGWRAFNALRAVSPHARVDSWWVGQLDDGDSIIPAWATTMHRSGGYYTTPFLTGSPDMPGYIGVFRLPSPGDTGFHGCLLRRTNSDPFHGGPTSNVIAEAAVFDPDGMLETDYGFWVGNAGIWLVASAWTFTVTGADWTDARDFQLIGWLGDHSNAAVPDNPGDIWVPQVGIGGADIVDCGATVNEVTVSSLWIGALRAGDGGQSIAIPDVLSPSTIVVNTDPAKTYLAAIRLADAP